MIKNYFKIAWRNLLKSKGFSFINISGLALGMACSLLILLWIQDERAMNKFHEEGDRIYQVYENQFYSGEPNTYSSTPGILAENIVEEIPEIEIASQVLWEEDVLFTVGDNVQKEYGRYVQNDFLKIFSFKLKAGDPNTALDRPDAVVITQELADKYFPGEDPIGKRIIADNEDDMMVTGILEDIPSNSSLDFDFLMSWDRWIKYNTWATQWGNNGPRCFVKLAENADVNLVNDKIRDYVKGKQRGSNVELFLHSFEDSYLYSNFENGVQDGGRIEYVRIFSIIAVFILLIACINFMNLATARSVKRAKEIGVRKAIGATKNTLIGQFYGEAILITIISLFVAVLLVTLLLPSFNTLTSKELVIDYTDPSLLLLLFLLLVVTSLMSGSYPALFMSSLKPVVVLKGALKFKPSATFFRKGLVVFQFALSIMLILGMIVIYNQLNFIQNKNLGFDKENLVYFPTKGSVGTSFLTFQNELNNLPGIKSVTASMSSPLQLGSSTQDVFWRGKDTTDIILFDQTQVSEDYLSTMNIELLDGRDFSYQYGTDTAAYMINESAARAMGFENPVGEEIVFWGNRGPIVGLVKDFHQNSLHQPIAPLVIRLFPEDEHWGYALARTEPGKVREALEGIEATYKKFAPRFPFEYEFADEEFMTFYRSEATVSSLSNYFAFMAIFISCLGLFGLATFTAEQRTKEIGIRKVMGANFLNLITIMSKEFIGLVLISSVIALPLAWYFSKGWLENFEYRIDIEWWYFLIAVLGAVALAIITVSYQSTRVALANPVKSLKSE